MHEKDQRGRPPCTEYKIESRVDRDLRGARYKWAYTGDESMLCANKIQGLDNRARGQISTNLATRVILALALWQHKCARAFEQGVSNARANDIGNEATKVKAERGKESLDVEGELVRVASDVTGWAGAMRL